MRGGELYHRTASRAEGLRSWAWGTMDYQVSYSYIATANAIRHCSAIPVFVDIGRIVEYRTSLVEANITPATKAILCVHQIGVPAT